MKQAPQTSTPPERIHTKNTDLGSLDVSSPTKELSTEKLFREFKETKDPEVASLLYDKFSPQIYGIARRMGLNHAHAEDAVQVSMIQIFERADTHNPKQKVTPWALAVAKNKTIDHARTVFRVAKHEHDASSMTQENSHATKKSGDPLEYLATPNIELPDQIVSQLEERQNVLRAIYLLKERYKKTNPDKSALFEMLVEPPPSSEIAKKFQIPVNTAKWRISAARKELKAELSERYRESFEEA